MDRIAIISDVHGNLEALNSTFQDIKERNIEIIYCLGDIIAKGNNQEECIKLIKKNCQIILKGNCDDYFTSDIDLSDKNERQKSIIKWNKSKISEESSIFLKELPFCHEFYMSGRLIRLLHAHPLKIDKFAGNIDKIERIYELLLPSENTISNEKADVLVYGHIHMPYSQKMYNRTIINTGSVGNAIDVFRNDLKDGDERNTTVANYLILSGILNKRENDKFSFELVSVPYDIDKELSFNSDNVEFDYYKDELKFGKYRNMTAIYDSFKDRGIDQNNI